MHIVFVNKFVCFAFMFSLKRNKFKEKFKKAEELKILSKKQQQQQQQKSSLL